MSCCCCPTPWFSADAVFLDRDNRANDQLLVLDVPTGNTLLRTPGLDFDNATGIRIMAGAHPTCCCFGWEVGYLGLHEWDATATAAGQVGLPGALGNQFNAANAIQIRYESELHSGELNRVRSAGCAENIYLDWIYGLRYVRLEEELLIRSIFQPVGAAPAMNDYRIETENDLFGGQIGFRLREGDCCRLVRWDITGKAGVYANVTEQSTSIQLLAPGNNVAIRTAEADDTKAAFVGELHANVRVPITCSWHLQAGYHLLWLEGVALAPDQLDFTNTPLSSTSINTDGGAFFHGATVGVYAQW